MRVKERTKKKKCKKVELTKVLKVLNTTFPTGILVLMIRVMV